MSNRSPLVRSLGAVLSGTLLFQAAAADASAALWQERRLAASRHPVQLASSSLPLPRPLPISAALSEPASAGSRSSSATDSIIADLSAALPASLGRLELPRVDKSGAPVVLVVHDVHRNEEAQRAISSAVTALCDRGLASLVGLEGAPSEPLPLESFREFPAPDVTRNVADYFLRTGQISGAVHGALSGARPLPPVIGLEQPSLYDRNVEAVRRADRARPAVQARLALERTELEKKKAAIFPPALLSLDRDVVAYHDGKLGLGPFLRRLSAAAGRPPANVARFLAALDLEERLSFPTIERERSALIEALMRRVNADGAAALAGAAIAYRAGTMSPAAFYATLEKIAAGNDVRLSAYPALADYFRYVALIDGIDGEALLDEATVLERSAYRALASDDVERGLIRDSRRLALTDKLLSFSLASADWAEYKTLRTANPALDPFEDFYRAAEARDEALTANLIAAIRRQHATLAVVVAGGFHAGGMRALLAKSGLTCVGFVPRLTKADLSTASAYLSAFTREKLPIEKIFAGEKLFLAQPPVAPELAHLLPASQVATRLRAAPGERAALARYYAARRGERGRLEDVSVAANESTLRFEETTNGGAVEVVDSFDYGPGNALTGVASRPRRAATLDSTYLAGRLVFGGVGLAILSLAVLLGLSHQPVLWMAASPLFIFGTACFAVTDRFVSIHFAPYWEARLHALPKFVDLHNPLDEDEREWLETGRYRIISAIVEANFTRGSWPAWLTSFFAGARAHREFNRESWRLGRRPATISSRGNPGHNPALDAAFRLVDALGRPDWHDTRQAAIAAELARNPDLLRAVAPGSPEVFRLLERPGISPSLLPLMSETPVAGVPSDVLWFLSAARAARVHFIGSATLLGPRPSQGDIARLLTESLFIMQAGAAMIAAKSALLNPDTRAEGQRLLSALDAALKARAADVSLARVTESAAGFADYLESLPLFDDLWMSDDPSFTVLTEFLPLTFARLHSTVARRDLSQGVHRVQSYPLEVQLTALSESVAFSPEPIRREQRVTDALAILHHLDRILLDGTVKRVEPHAGMPMTLDTYRAARAATFAGIYSKNVYDFETLAAHFPEIFDRAEREPNDAAAHFAIGLLLLVFPELLDTARASAFSRVYRNSDVARAFPGAGDLVRTHPAVVTRALAAIRQRAGRLPTLGFFISQPVSMFAINHARGLEWHTLTQTLMREPGIDWARLNLAYTKDLSPEGIDAYRANQLEELEIAARPAATLPDTYKAGRRILRAAAVILLLSPALAGFMIHPSFVLGWLATAPLAWAAVSAARSRRFLSRRFAPIWESLSHARADFVDRHNPVNDAERRWLEAGQRRILNAIGGRRGLRAWWAGVKAHALFNDFAWLNGKRPLTQEKSSAAATPEANLPIHDFLAAVGLENWATTANDVGIPAERFDTPDGPMSHRRAPLATLPAQAADLLRVQFGDRTRRHLGRIEVVDFLYDEAGRLIGILPIPNELMVRMHIAAERTKLDESLKSRPGYAAAVTLQDELDLRPIYLSDTYFVPPQPGTVDAATARAAWQAHEVRAMHEARLMDAYIRRSPMSRYYRRPVYYPEEDDPADAGKPPVRPSSAFAFVHVTTDDKGRRQPAIENISATDVTTGHAERRPSIIELKPPVGEYKAITPVLPTVYNPGLITKAKADQGYHRQLLHLGIRYRQLMGRPILPENDRIFINGIGSGVDAVTAYIGWMIGVGRRPFERPELGPRFDVWDINPFARANALALARWLGLRIRLSPPNAGVFHDFVIQNRPAFALLRRSDAVKVDRSLEQHYDSIPSDTFLEDVRFYREKLRGGNTLAILWDAEYWEGEGDADKALAANTSYMPAVEGKEQVPVVQTTLQTGGEVLGRWANRDAAAAAPQPLKVVPLHLQLGLTHQAVYATWAVRSVEPRPGTLDSTYEAGRRIFRLLGALLIVAPTVAGLWGHPAFFLGLIAAAPLAVALVSLSFSNRFLSKFFAPLYESRAHFRDRFVDDHHPVDEIERMWLAEGQRRIVTAAAHAYRASIARWGRLARLTGLAALRSWVASVRAHATFNRDAWKFGLRPLTGSGGEKPRLFIPGRDAPEEMVSILADVEDAVAQPLIHQLVDQVERNREAIAGAAAAMIRRRPTPRSIDRVLDIFNPNAVGARNTELTAVMIEAMDWPQIRLNERLRFRIAAFLVNSYGAGAPVTRDVMADFMERDDSARIRALIVELLGAMDQHHLDAFQRDPDMRRLIEESTVALYEPGAPPGDGAGSAFVIAEDDGYYYLLSASHVADSEPLEARHYNSVTGRTTVGPTRTVLRLNHRHPYEVKYANDVAVLAMAKSDVPGLRLKPVELAFGAENETHGLPAAVVSGLYRTVRESRSVNPRGQGGILTFSQVQRAAPARQSGDSGSPVATKIGERALVIGLHVRETEWISLLTDNRQRLIEAWKHAQPDDAHSFSRFVVIDSELYARSMPVLEGAFNAGSPDARLRPGQPLPDGRATRGAASRNRPASGPSSSDGKKKPADEPTSRPRPPAQWRPNVDVVRSPDLGVGLVTDVREEMGETEIVVQFTRGKFATEETFSPREMTALEYVGTVADYARSLEEASEPPAAKETGGKSGARKSKGGKKAATASPASTSGGEDLPNLNTASDAVIRRVLADIPAVAKLGARVVGAIVEELIYERGDPPFASAEQLQERMDNTVLGVTADHWAAIAERFRYDSASDSRDRGRPTGPDFNALFSWPDFSLNTVRLSDAEVERYFGTSVLNQSRAEGRVFYFRPIDPVADRHYLDDWRRDIAGDRDWVERWESRHGPLNDRLPRTGTMGDWGVGLVSVAGGQERLEGFLGAEPVTETFDAARGGYLFRLHVGVIELYYRNIGHTREVPGVVDALWDYALKFMVEHGRFSGGVDFFAMSEGSVSFAERRGIPHIGGGHHGLSRPEVTAAYERLHLDRTFNDVQSSESSPAAGARRGPRPAREEWVRSFSTDEVNRVLEFRNTGDILYVLPHGVRILDRQTESALQFALREIVANAADAAGPANVAVEWAVSRRGESQLVVRVINPGAVNLRAVYDTLPSLLGFLRELESHAATATDHSILMTYLQFLPSTIDEVERAIRDGWEAFDMNAAWRLMTSPFFSTHVEALRNYYLRGVPLRDPYRAHPGGRQEPATGGLGLYLAVTRLAKLGIGLRLETRAGDRGPETVASVTIPTNRVSVDRQRFTSSGAVARGAESVTTPGPQTAEARTRTRNRAYPEAKPAFDISPVQLTDAEIERYFGAAVLRQAHADGRAYYFRPLQPGEGLRTVDAWRRQIAADTEWRSRWEAVKGPWVDEMPVAKAVGDWAFALVSVAEGQERIEGFIGGTPVLDVPHGAAGAYRLSIGQIELYYRNVGRHSELPGAADALWDFALKFVAEHENMSGGMRFVAATGGSMLFAQRRGIPALQGGPVHGLTGSQVLFHYRVRGLASTFKGVSADDERTPDRLVMDFSRDVAEWLGFERTGAAAEIGVASVVEGTTFLHFLPFFPLLHRNRSWHMVLGMAMIYVGAFALAAFMSPDALVQTFTSPQWASALTTLFWVWLGGIAGHAAYNTVARALGWARLARFRVDLTDLNLDPNDMDFLKDIVAYQFNAREAIDDYRGYQNLTPRQAQRQLVSLYQLILHQTRGVTHLADLRHVLIILEEISRMTLEVDIADLEIDETSRAVVKAAATDGESDEPLLMRAQRILKSDTERKAWRLVIRINKTVKSQIGKAPLAPALARAIASLDEAEGRNPPLDWLDIELTTDERAAVALVRAMGVNPMATLEELRSLWKKPTPLQTLWQVMALAQKIDYATAHHGLTTAVETGLHNFGRVRGLFVSATLGDVVDDARKNLAIADWVRTAMQRWAAAAQRGETITLSSIAPWIGRDRLPDDRARVVAQQIREAALLVIGSHRPDDFLGRALMRLGDLSQPEPTRLRSRAWERRQDLKDRARRGTLTLGVTRAIARVLGLNPYGAATEVAFAPIVEGGLLIHFLPFFPWLHSEPVWRPVLGMLLIYGAATVAMAWVVPGAGLFDVSAVLHALAAGDKHVLLAGWIGGMIGHSAHAVARRLSAERRVAESLVDFATAFADGRAAGRPLNALEPPILDFDMRHSAAPTAPATLPSLNLGRLNAEISAVMAERGGRGALADPAVARTVVRLFWMMGLKPAQALPDGDLLFPNVAALNKAITGAPADRNPVLYVLASPAEVPAIEALSARLGRPIRAVVGERGFATGGHLDFGAVDSALLAQLSADELGKIRFVLESADIETLMAMLSHLPEGSALRQIRYLAIETILSVAVPFSATNLIEMNTMAQALAAKQA